MRILHMAVVAIMAAPVPSVCLGQDKATQDKGAVQELQKLRQGWADAVVKRDSSAFNRIEDESYVFTGPEGKLWTKAQDIEALKASAVESAKLEDTDVRIFGNAAVMRGRITYKGRFGGKDITGQYRFTETFVKDDGKWRCVACSMSRCTP